MSELTEQFKKVKPGDLGIFGDPVEHSLSPVFQNAALKESKRNIVYHAFQIRSSELAEAVQLAAKSGLRGLNVTVPHKSAVLIYVDEQDPIVKAVNAANTLVFEKGKISAFNTDAFGFEQALKEDLRFDPKGKTALILGAGGTAGVMLYVLRQKGIKNIFWWNRSRDRSLSSAAISPDLVRLNNEHEINRAMEKIDLVVNATSVGLSPSDGLPVPGLAFRAGQAVFDVVYHRETEFLNAARLARAQPAGGLGMLLHQGAKSYEIWTGSPAPLDTMRRALLNAIKKG